MLFTKPTGMKYTDICMEFDKEFYEKDRDDTKLYRDMYLIYYMLACKKNYFPKYETYDDYAQFAATTVYMRFIKKQKNGERIKSLLNYAKASAYPLKVMYQNWDFNEVFDGTHNDLDPQLLTNNIKDSIQSSYLDGLSDDVVDVLDKIPSTINDVIMNTPYKNDKLMVHRLYMSCLLTILNGVTLNNADIARIRKKKPEEQTNDEPIINALNKERENSCIVWGLDQSMSDYVTVLSNKVRAELSATIDNAKDDYILPDDILDAIAASSYSNYQENTEMEDDD
jgi:hypothetical protein